MRIFKVGTRDSLLALTQTKQIVAELIAKTGAQFEIVAMKTTGDLDTSKPLWQMDGKNFFTKELDQALLAGEIDCMVSSYKDIGGERPISFAIGCVTERLFSQDILLIKKQTVDKLSSMKLLKVGTSSPRRIHNITNGLADYLPNNHLGITCSTLRGNVNTRIKKLQDGQYDAIILALAGIERLARDPEAAAQLKELLHGLTFMVLPQMRFPSAPAQGALLIECRKDDSELLEVLKKVHHLPTAFEVNREREIFQRYGGGCHLALGVFSKDIADGILTIKRGSVDGKNIESIHFANGKDLVPVGKKAFVGMPSSKNEESEHYIYDAMIAKEGVEKIDLSNYQSIFLTSSYGLDYLVANKYRAFLWASGDKTFRLAAQKGFWVHGSADAMGDEFLQKLLHSEALKLMGIEELTGVLTANSSSSQIGPVIPCYQRKARVLDQQLFKELHMVEVFYWSSAYQFDQYLKEFPDITWDKVIHCCGLGKTYSQLKERGIAAYPFATIDSFKRWFSSHA